MKQYPEIQCKAVSGQAVYAFDKLDGSNIRAEWTRKRGFWKFGTRTRLLDPMERPLGEAVDLFMMGQANELGRRFKEERWQEATAFMEFWGRNSFAGTHQDEEHFVSLIDVSVHKRGIVLPRDYLDLTEGLPRARFLYHGNASEPFIESVRSGTLEGMTFEGVVCKGPYVTPGMPLMFKVKSRAWFDRLRGICGGDEEKFRRLS
jgi:hypothetical protein